MRALLLFLLFASPSQALETKKDSGLLASRGGIPNRVVEEAVREQGPLFRSCYNQQFHARRKKPRGSVTTRIGVDSHGRVTFAASTASDFPAGLGDSLVACVENVFKATGFPPPKGGGSAELDYALHFPLGRN